MEDNIRLAGIENRLGNLATETAGVKSDVGTIKTELSEVRRSVSAISGGIRTAEIIIGLLLLVVLGAVGIFGKAFIRDTAREVVSETLRSEMRDLDTRVQFGVFSAKTKTSDDPLAFDWTLQQSVKPDQLVSMTAEPLVPVPGVSITAQLANDGTVCRMTAKGNVKNMMAMLDDGIPGKVTVTVRK